MDDWTFARPAAFARSLSASTESSRIPAPQSPPSRTTPTHPTSQRSPSPIAVGSSSAPSPAPSQRLTDNPQTSRPRTAAPAPPRHSRPARPPEPHLAMHLQSTDSARPELKAPYLERPTKS